jgi:hypothetical protein
MRKEKNRIIIIIINISGRSSLEEVNHVKSIGQKYGSNGALGNFSGSPNPRTQPKDPYRGLLVDHRLGSRQDLPSCLSEFNSAGNNMPILLLLLFYCNKYAKSNIIK